VLSTQGWTGANACFSGVVLDGRAGTVGEGVYSKARARAGPQIGTCQAETGGGPTMLHCEFYCERCKTKWP